MFPDSAPDLRRNGIRISHLRRVYPADSSWLSRPDNMRMVHETMKRVGYDKLLDRADASHAPWLSEGVYLERSLLVVVDDLRASRTDPASATAYGRAFWERRAQEHNAEAAWIVLTDVQSYLATGITPPFDMAATDPVLFALLEMEFPTSKPRTALDTQRDAATLIALGMHESAYNVMFERNEYPAMPAVHGDWLLARLVVAGAGPGQAAWFGDNTP